MWTTGQSQVDLCVCVCVFITCEEKIEMHKTENMHNQLSRDRIHTALYFGVMWESAVCA